MKSYLNAKVVLLILVVVGFTSLATYYFVKPKNSLQNPLSTRSADYMNEINLSSFDDSDSLKYFRSQISAPASYYSTDDFMLSPYDSQGGMAPPRLILTKGQQVLGNYFDEVVNTPKNDCIVVWSTNGFTSIDDWNTSITGFDGRLGNKSVIKVGSRDVSIYSMSLTTRDIYIALLPIGNKENTTYFFHTCNMNNKSDFENVIKSIKFRADLNL